MQRVYGTAFFSDKELKAHLHADRGSEEARPPQARQGARALHVPPVGAGRGVLAGQGHDALQHARELHARGALPGRLRRGEDAARLQQGAVGDVRALAALPPEHVPRRSRDGEQMAHEGDELPRAHPGLRQRDAQLPRPAAPLPRADAAAPQRGVGRAVRADPRPPVLAGRCALLRDARSRSATKSSGCCGWCSASTATSACSTRRSCRPGPTEFLGEVATWDHAEAQLKQALERGRPGLHRQRRRRRVLRAEDRLRRHRRDRPQVAVRHDPARLPAAGAVRPEVHRRRQRRAPAGRHPPGDFRQLRAVHRAS